MFLIPELKEFDYILKLDGIWTKKRNTGVGKKYD